MLLGPAVVIEGEEGATGCAAAQAQVDGRAPAVAADLQRGSIAFEGSRMAKQRLALVRGKESLDRVDVYVDVDRELQGVLRARYREPRR
jgi:hypothetical protein